MKIEYGIVVIGETPYAEGLGDNGTLTLPQEDIDVFNKMRAQCEKLILVLLTGRPVLVTDLVAQADAVVAAWQPGTEAAGLADLIFGDVPFSGTLSFSWPRSIEQVPLAALKAHAEPPLFPLGHGLTT